MKHGWVWWLIVGGGTLFGIAIVSVIPLQGEDRARAMCDQAVAALLTTHDLVELQRAQALILDLNCGVRKRLPR